MGDALSRLHRAYLEHLEAQRFSPSTVSVAKNLLPLFFDHLREQGVRDVRAAGYEHLVAFARRLQTLKTARGRSYSDATQQMHISSVKRFFTFLTKKRLILLNPALDLHVRRVSALGKGVLSQSQARRLMEAPDSSTLGQRDRAVLEMLYGTGMRLSECVRLRLEDVDLQQKLVWIRDGKGRKDRLVPLPAQALRAVALYLREARGAHQIDPRQDALFLSLQGRPLNGPTLRHAVKHHAQAVGLTLSPHALRHACATHLLENGADIRHIQRLLGHADIRSTAIYTRVAVADLKRVVARTHPREKQLGPVGS